MKTTSTNFYSLVKAFIFLVVLGIGKTYAQAPFSGGSTYWVNGNGTDIVAPKDTFQSLMGAYSGGAYNTTTGVFSALTTNGVDPLTSGTINIVLASGYVGFTENSPLAVGDPAIGGYPYMSASRPVVVKPASGLNINITAPSVTLAANASFFRLNGVQYFTFDGQSTPGQRNVTLSVSTTSTTTSVRVVDFIAVGQNMCKNATVQNCVVVGNSTTTAINTFAGFYVGGTSATPSNSVVSNQNISIINNDIRAVNYGIYARGNGSGVNTQDNGLVISNNIIGGVFGLGSGVNVTYVGGLINGSTAGAAGIYLSAQKNATISGNTVRNCLPTFTYPSSPSPSGNQNIFTGILLDNGAGTTALDSNITINGNKIYRLFTSLSTPISSSLFYYTMGIRITLGTHTQPLNNSIVNNAISAINNTANLSNATNGGGGTISTLSQLNYPIGIAIEDNSANAGVNIYHNSINMYGDSLPTLGVSACLAFSTNTTGGVNVRNNIFANRMGRSAASTGSSTSVLNVANLASSSYGIIVNNVTLAPFNSIGNNAFYTTNFRGTFSFVGYLRGRNRVSVYETGQNWGFASYPPFATDTTLALSNGSPSTLDTSGVPVGVTTDINGVIRSTTMPSVGAFEFARNNSTAYYPLMAGNTYPINGVNNFPAGKGGAGSFATVADAINYMNSFGVMGTGQATLQIQSGYPGENRAIPTIVNFGGSATSTVALTVASGFTANITPPSVYFRYGSTFRILGGRFFTIDGTGSSNSNAININAPASLNGTDTCYNVISICATDTLPATDITIAKCNITGNSVGAITGPSPVNTFAGIYSGYYQPATTFITLPQGSSTVTLPSALTSQNAVVGQVNNINILYDTIQAVKFGVFHRGANIQYNQSRNWLIKGNVIGGRIVPGTGSPTTYFGGAPNAAGIFIDGMCQSTIDSNVIRNSVKQNNTAVVNASTAYNPRGIELSNISGTNAVDSGIVISRNTITKIENTSVFNPALFSTTNGAYGILINLGNASSRALTISNNMISGITSKGSQSPTTVPSIYNPYGILVDGTGSVTNLGLSLFYNTINLGASITNPINQANGTSAALMFTSAITGGVSATNNIFQNLFGSSPNNNGRACAIGIGAKQNIFTTIGNNDYVSNAPGSANIMAVSNYANGPIYYGNVAAFSAYTLQDTASFSAQVNFTNDSVLLIPNLANTSVYTAGAPVSGITTDLLGTTRSATTPTVGAHEYNGSYADSLSPNVFNVTVLPACSNGPYNITMKVYEKSAFLDTLYYSVNGGAQVALVNPSVDGNNRTFTIPAQAPNSSIGYYYTVKDAVNRVTRNPASGQNFIYTTTNQFPMAQGFDIDTKGWNVSQISGNGNWDLSSYGSPNLPALLPATGLKAAVFPGSAAPAGTVSRITSPCMDITGLKNPMLSIWASQSADLATILDAIDVKVIINGVVSPSIKNIQRVNTTMAAPGFVRVDICLNSYSTNSAIAFAIDATAAGNGNNLVIDSILISDDLYNLPVTTSVSNVGCLTNTVTPTLNIAGTNSAYSYKFVNMLTGLDFSSGLTGNGGSLAFSSINNSGVDSAYLRVRYTNIAAPTCTYLMNDTTKIYVRKFNNSPVLTNNTAVTTGQYNSGTLLDPDIVKPGDVISYALNAPTGYTNAQYGTLWTIVNQSIKTASNTAPSSATFTPPSGSGQGTYNFNPTAGENDSTFIMNISFRFLGTATTCDSTITRYIKVSAPNTATNKPFTGGMTYVVNGNGNDFVAPKDTFMNLMGTYTGGPFSRTTGVLPALTINGVDATSSGNITILLAPGYNGIEATAISVGDPTVGGYSFMSANRPVVMKVAPGVTDTITTTATIANNQGLFTFHGVQYFTIDGSNSGGGSRNLVFRMPIGSTSSLNRVIHFNGIGQNGCQYITVKNCVVIGNSSVTTPNTFAGFYFGGATTPSNEVKSSRNITIDNNLIQAVQCGVYARGIGTSFGSHDFNLTVSNNLIGGDIAPGGTDNTTYIGGSGTGSHMAGIYLAAQANAVVTGNVIKNNIPSGGAFVGIKMTTTDASSFSPDSNCLVSGNRIYNIISTSATNPAVNGIRYTVGGAHAWSLNNTFANNTIGNIMSTNAGNAITGLQYAAGILIEDNSLNAGVNIYNNTVNMYGDTLLNGSFSACLVTGPATLGGVKVVNNLFSNRSGRNSTATGTQAASYGVVSLSATSNPFSKFSSNALYINNWRGSNSFLGYHRSMTRTSFRELNGAFNGTNNIGVIPPFIGGNDSTMVIANNTASVLGNSGEPIASVTTDINGVARNASNPSIGAYEFTPDLANANYPLFGGNQYNINGVNAWPVGAIGGAGTFATVADAVNYINHYGVTGAGNVLLNITSGYAKENRFIPAINEYPGTNSARSVTIGISSGYFDTIMPPNQAQPNQFSVIRMIGARWVTIDGRNKNLTIAMPALGNNNNSKLVSICPSDSLPTSNITIKNCILTGQSTASAINTYAGIYHGNHTPTGATASSSPSVGVNNNITVDGNLIQAVRNGIYVRGANIAGAQNLNWNIKNNTIGGTTANGGSANTTYIGGNSITADDQGGIILKSVAQSLVEGNTIRNSIPVAASSGFKGIDINALGEINGKDSAITISKNMIFNLSAGLVGNTYTYGIRINLGSDSLRALSIVNNSISKIQGTGSGTNNSSTNPMGIFVDAPTTISNLGLTVYFNSIQLTGNVLLNGSSSSCLLLNTSIGGGVSVHGNILSNTMGRISGTGNVYSLFIGSASAAGQGPMRTPNGTCNFNAYYAGSSSSSGFIGCSANGAINYGSLAAWKVYTGQDVGSYFIPPAFKNDTTPDLDPSLSGAVANGAAALSSVPTDIYGSNRGPTLTNIGAVQFSQTFAPLTGGGTYQINGIQNPPTSANPTTGSFATVNRAIQYINANGVDNITAPANPIKLLITSGYNGEGDTLIAALIDYPRMNANRPITLTLDAGRNDTIRTLGVNQPYAANGSVFRIAGGAYFTIDGSNNGSTTRNLTFMLPVGASNNTLKVVDITAQNLATTNVTIKNCNIVGQSTNAAINTFAGIYMGGVASTPSNVSITGNNNITIQNNYIVAVRNGIYFQGLSAATNGLGNTQDLGLAIKSNTIGGNNNIGGSTATDFFGGANSSYGIFLSAQSGAVVDGNTVRNSLKGFANCAGIALSNLSGQVAVDSNITISNNIVSKIENTTAGGGAYGIYSSLGTTSKRNITMFNNMVSGIAAPGTNTTPQVSVASAYGIFVDASGINTDYGLNLWNNSVNLGRSSAITVTNGTSAALYLGSGIRGGVSSMNNIFQNTLGRTLGAGTGRSYAVLVGANANVFSASEYNNYFVNGSLSNNFVMATNAATNPILYRTVDTLVNLTRQDTLSISFVTPFTNDTNLFIPFATASPIFGGGKPLAAVQNDIQGTARSFTATVIGAHEYLGSYIDSVAPKAFNVTPAVSCSNGPFTITLRVIERVQNVATDTLYYSVNGVAKTPLVNPVVSGMNRTFVIPAQPTNSSIEWNYAVRDNSVFSYRATYPTTGSAYLSTMQGVFPLTYGFDLPNTQGWAVEQVAGAGGWNLDSYGSGNQPILGAATGNKAAIFPAASLPAGTASRLVSPCLDLVNMKVPTLRFWISQNDDLPSNRDSVLVKVSALPGVWSAPLKTVYRVPNPAVGFARFVQVDVCLQTYVGLSGLKVALEAGAKGNGNNIVLDSIMIFDDVINTTVSPSTAEVCLYNNVNLTVNSTQTGYNYQFINTLTGGNNFGPTVAGTGGSVVMSTPNLNMDTIVTRLKYTNVSSGCSDILTPSQNIYIKKFTNGPYMSKGATYTGNYSVGSQAQPDAGKDGDVLTYEFKAPSGLSNSSYGTSWTVANVAVKTVAGTNATQFVLNPAGAGNANLVISPKPADGDSLFKLTATIRLLPSGCDSTLTRWVKVTSAPNASFLANGGTNTGCAKSTVSFANTTSAAQTTLPIAYSWDFGDGKSDNVLSPVHVYDTAGTYLVTMRATNNVGIVSTATATITVKDAPTPNFTFGNVCAGAPVVLTNTSARANTYAWDFILNGSSEGTSSSTDPIYAFAVGDTAYSVQMTATNTTTGCARTITKTVYSFPKPTAAFATNGHCLGTNVSITNNTTVNTTKPNSSFGSEWEFGNGQKGLSNQPYYIYPASGTYSIKLKVTTNFGCKDSATNLITVFDRPVPSFTVANTCQYDVVQLTNNTTFSGGLSKVSYSWDFGDNTNSDQANPVKIYGITDNVAIKLVVMDTIHFCKDSMIRFARVYNKPTAGFIVDATKGCVGQEFKFTNASTVALNEDSLNNWDFADATSSTDKDPAHTFTAANEYKVVLIVTTKNNCKDTAEKTIKVSTIPNIAFTWANDNTGDSCRNEYTKVFTPNITTLSSYSWSFGDNTSSTTTGNSVKNVYNFKGKYYACLIARDANGCSGQYCDTVRVGCSVGLEDVKMADIYKLNISPNPFTQTTNINYTLLSASKVKIQVFDLLGRNVAAYDLGTETSGVHQFTLDADKFNGSSSAYMVKIEIDGATITQKIIQAR